MDAKMLAFQKDRIIGLLLGTAREGMNELIEYLGDEGFFCAPASTKFHGCYVGGLAKHSLGVYENLVTACSDPNLDKDTTRGRKPLEITKDTFIIAGLLHDVCKVGAYLGTEKPYKWNSQQPDGHAKLSIERIKKYIKLEPLEEMMIRFHMGFYGMIEFVGTTGWEAKYGEYHLLGDYTDCPFDKETHKKERQEWAYGKSVRNAYYHNPIVKYMYFADERATMEEKTSEV